MSLTSAAISQNRVTAVAIAVLLLSGLSAYKSMPKQMDPGITVRNAQIITIFPGASPERIEQLVTDPIEQAVQSIPQLDFVKSTSRTGVSIVIVAVKEKYKVMRPIWDDLRRKVDSARDNLPSGIIGPNVNDELGDLYPILFTMTVDGFDDREVAEISETIRDELLHIDGVARVELVGAQEERVFVEYRNSRLQQLGISPMQLQSILQARNIIMPGGEIDIGPEALVLEPSGNFVSVEELGRTLINLPGGDVTYLGDVTDIRRGYRDPQLGAVTADGRRGVTFAISMTSGDNLLDVGAKMESFFGKMAVSYPHGIDFQKAYFQPKDVEAKVDEFLSSVVQAVIIVMVVMLLFLGLRTGLVVSTLIPAAMVITIFLMSLIGESINQMSLASLIIALGLLVDNAIVVSESILVRLSAGETKIQAAIAACKELQMPLLISSLTTAVAFLPIFLAESAVGEYTGALFKVVSITLLVSWLLALTMTPLLCVMFLRAPKSSGDDFNSRFYRGYRAALGTTLRHRLISIIIVIVVFIGSLQLWSLVPAIFFPPQASPFLIAKFELPPGINIKQTQEMSAKLDAYIESELRAKGEQGGVVSWTSFIGETPPSFTLGFSPSPSLAGYCELMVNVSAVEDVRQVMNKLDTFAHAEFPDVKTHIRMLSAGPPVDKPIQIRISGTDTTKIFAIVDRVKAKLREHKDIRNVNDDWGARVKKLAVTVDEERARRAGVTNQDVAISMQSFLSGLETTRYREEDESIPVIVRSVESERRQLTSVRGLSVFSSQTGQTVPLSQVADIGLQWQPSKVLRRDRYRTVTVESQLADGATAIAIFNELRPWLEAEAKSWPVGYRWEYGGEFESSVKANESIGVKLPIAGLLIVLLLVLQFNSLRKPVIVLSTIILALIGVVIGLVTMKSYFGFMTLLGVVSLAGIVVNNAIVLLDRIQIEIDNGNEPAEAVVLAAQQRLRPILLTTATTVASLIPLYISGGEMWQPMAVAIMFGLVFSTVLTLLVVPLLYSLFYRVSDFKPAS